MPITKICCICGISSNKKIKDQNPRTFFVFPNPNNKSKAASQPFEKNLLEKRLAAWKNVVGSNFDKCKIGLTCVCSDHFHAGKLQLSRKI